LEEKMTETSPERDTKPAKNTGITRWAVQMILSTIFFAAILFLSAGKLDWVAGWAFLGMNTLTQILSGLVLIPRQPEMLAGRTRRQKDTKDWDRLLAPLVMIVGTLGVIVVAGLDQRFEWSAPFASHTWVIGLVLAFACQMFVLWAMTTNAFFATTVRIQDDAGHHVVSSGPYRIVRHPGYFGSVIYNLLCPLALASLWTFIPAVLTVILLFVRTGLEDRTLQAELPGYTEYAKKVHYRLIPGVW
jgi:protein-S-isoprenylcysteine O-methyltransferase Ste14